MKVVVTGAAGFIGSHTADALVDVGFDVIGIDSLDPGVHRAAPDYLNPRVEYCFADLRHWNLDDRFNDVELIVHFAALGGVARASREPANIIDANCRGTARLVEFGRKLKRLQRIVHASSFSVYGSNYSYRCSDCGVTGNGRRREKDMARGRYEVVCSQCGSDMAVLPIDENATPNPLETYGASKYMQELCYRGFDRAPVNIMRFSSAYGTRLRLEDGEATIIAKLAGWIRARQAPQLFEDGQQIRDWVHVSDIVATVIALASGGDGPPMVNVCSGKPTRLVEACDILAETMRVDCKPKIVGGYRPGDMRHCLGDATTLRRLIGREPVTFREGAASAFST
ncbi:MAG TPA: NAD-dependent epimerase/dehydratase family protein [Thermoanaerobaculia bacterium]|nr:NAD-dependent epimerase/dehydratase family protein [Thermoanaerobaculia bacterium]